MRVYVTHNAAEVDAFVRVVFAKQLPFVESQAINDAAKAAQAVQRAHQRQVFTVRRPGFVDRAVKIKPFATKRKPEAKIAIDPPGGQARASILIQHEAELEKTPDGMHVAVPTEHVKRTAAGVIRKSERPSALLLRELSGRKHRGERRATFRHEDTIFERLRNGRIRALYQLVPSVDLDQRLRFVDNVIRTVRRVFPAAFTKRFDKAIRTARR